jgi:hypothetical protein
MSGFFGSRPLEVPEGSALLMKTWSDGEAEIVRQLLEANDIPCQVISDITHSVYPVAVDGLGEIRIFVSEASLAEASAMLADHLREGLDSVSEDGSAGDGGDGDGPAGTGGGGERR